MADASTEVVIEVERSPLVVAIREGDSTTIGYDAPLVIDANATSFDPDDDGTTLVSAATFAWSPLPWSVSDVSRSCPADGGNGVMRSADQQPLCGLQKAAFPCYASHVKGRVASLARS